MQGACTPWFIGSSVVLSAKTIFRTFEKEIVVKVPGNLIRQLLRLCDGNKTISEVIDQVKNEWDETLVSSFLDELMALGIIVDSRLFIAEMWRVVENPAMFPAHVTSEEVAYLMELADKRSRMGSADQFFKPEPSALSGLLERRQSTRSFSGQLVPFQALIDMLWAGYGEISCKRNGLVRKTSPSAGALYPILIHIVLFQDSNNMGSGIYQVSYDQNGNVGLALVSKDTMRFARSFLSPDAIIDGVHGVVVVSGSFSITGEKYGNRSLLYVLLEAGHVAQNIMLSAVEHGVVTLEIGGFVDKLLSEAVDLPDQYKPLTTIAFGQELVEAKPESLEPPLVVDWAVPAHDGYRPSFAIASTRLSEERSWSHGRDASPKMALVKAVSEAKEWMACGCVPSLLKAQFGELETMVDPRDMIKFHPSQYRVKGFPFAKFDEGKEYEWAHGYEYISQSEKEILAELVYFPFFPSTPDYAFSNSSGCAAHPSEQVAIETATLELVERDAFVNFYLTKLACPTISITTLSEEVQGRVKNLRSAGFQVWFKDHSLDLAPVVMVFAQNDELFFTTCASCSSFDVENAVSHALMEVEASVFARLQNGAPVPIKPREVGFPLDHGRLYGQKEYYQRANFLVDGREFVSCKDIGKHVAYSWDDLLTCFNQKGWQLLCVPLSVSEKFGGNDGLHIVRCIVPGMVPMTFGYRQEPAGMERIYETAKVFGNKVLSYGELTKFPHPFE